MDKKGYESWGFKVSPTEDKNIFDYEGIEYPENKMRSYAIFPGITVLFIDFKHRYMAENSESEGTYGYRIGYSYEGNYYTHINNTRVLITREIFVGKSLPKSLESYCTSNKTIAFNIAISPKHIDHKDKSYKIISKFLKNVENIKDFGYTFNSRELIFLANQLIEALKNRDVILITLKILELMYRIANEKVTENRTKYYKEDAMKEEIYQIESYLKTHMKEDIDLNKICKEFKISKSYLNNRFMRIFQYTPMRYLNNMRLIKAEEILISTNKNIIDVCEEVGFKNPSNFARSFKKFTGLSPSKYRRHNKI
ncbi:helix-turn-helix domain-containing protein [Peptoniphilus sp. SGI.035]|uniref:helix-turn-helix domain-containing protein n=1 Tax=Peptoniphilus sp. SGI.035 TaxID=3420564 RepID=UPI003D030F41